ncbi:TPA: hypothetical protein QDU38_001190 [Escherichia coli]|nr:hypothetical protein [Escherichia coli]
MADTSPSATSPASIFRHYFIHADRLLEMRNGQLSELIGEERDAASRDAVARTA